MGRTVASCWKSMKFLSSLLNTILNMDSEVGHNAECYGEGCMDYFYCS